MAMASRLVLLPSLLVALVFVTLCAPSFVFGGRPASTTSLRSSTARAAVPEVLELQTSVTTALEVSTPGWWANIVTLVLPIAILLGPLLAVREAQVQREDGHQVSWARLEAVHGVFVFLVDGALKSERRNAVQEQGKECAMRLQRFPHNRLNLVAPC